MTPLQQAYINWDRAAGTIPRHPPYDYLHSQSRTLQIELERAGAELGVPSTELRDRISHYRKVGHHPAVAVQFAVESFE